MFPAKLQRQIDHLDAHPECSCVMTNQRVEIDAGVELPPMLQWLRGALRDNSPLPISVIVRTPTLYACGGFDPSLATSEDMDLLFRLRRGGYEIAQLPEALVIRRIHGDNATYTTPSQMKRDLLRAVRPPTLGAGAPRVSIVLPAGDGDA